MAKYREPSMGGKKHKPKKDTRSPSKAKTAAKKDTRSPSKVKSAVKKDTRSPSMKQLPAKKDAKPKVKQLPAKKSLSPAMKNMVKGVKKQVADRKARTAAAYQKLDAAKKKKRK